MTATARSQATVGCSGWRPRAIVAAALCALGALGCGGDVAVAQSSAQPPGLGSDVGTLGAGAPSFGECEAAVDEAALRREVYEGSREAMRRAALEVDYASVVADAWGETSFDRRFAVIVDDKIAILRRDRAYLERLLDGNIPSRAEEMAEKTAELVFYSEEFEALQGDLQNAIGARLEPIVASADLKAQTAAARCIRTFLGARYAASVREAFSDDLDATGGAVAIDSSGVETNAALSMAGVVAAMLTVVFRRLVQRVVRSIVRRLAGALAARLAAWASVILGAALLVYELIAGADGVFPILRDELTSPQTRAEIQNGLVEELAATGPERLDERAGAIAGFMFERWRSFKANHRAALELAEREPRFAAFMADQPPERFEALSVAVKALSAEAAAAERSGDAEVVGALDSGVLGEAVALPNAAQRIEEAAVQGLSLSDLVSWARLAGARFAQAVDWRLPSVLDPASVTRAEVARLLDLGAQGPALSVARLSPEARAEALTLPADQLRLMAQIFEGEALSGVFAAIRVLPEAGLRRRYYERALADPSRGRGLVNAQGAVRGSRNPRAALDLILDDAPLWSPFALQRHVETALDGEVSPLTLTHRYGWGLTVALGLPLLLLIGVIRWFAGFFGFFRRRRG